jgi:hypothetical protein
VRIQNVSPDPLLLPAPPERYVMLQARQGSRSILCRDEPPPAQPHFVTMPPGSQLELRIDVGRRCDVAGLDRYHLRVLFFLPRSAETPAAWSGLVGPAEVDTARTPTAADVPVPPRPLGAQLPSTSGGGALRLAPPEPPPRPRAGPKASLPPPAEVAPAQPFPSAPRALDVAQEACVDRELARLRLNAFGDPPGTRYPGGNEPPAVRRGESRAAYVLDRMPEVKAVCTVPSRTGG